MLPERVFRSPEFLLFILATIEFLFRLVLLPLRGLTRHSGRAIFIGSAALILGAGHADALTVTKINIEVQPAGSAAAAGPNRIVLETDAEPEFKVTDATGKPERLLYVDIYNLSKSYADQLLPQDNAALRWIHFTNMKQFKVLRVVLYVKPGATCAVTKTTAPHGLVITCQAGPESADAGSTGTVQTAAAGEGVRRQSIQLTQAPDAPQAQISAPGSQIPTSPLPPTPAPPRRSPPGVKKVVIIDPGHGGANSGARSRALVAGKAALEKDLTLAFAYKLKEIIDGTPNMVAIVTRPDDSNIGLQDRVHFAESRLGDLFVSIHMNDGDGNPSARGVEVYYLDEKGAATAAAKAVEERENKEVGDSSRKHSKSLLEGILTDISRGQLDNMKVESNILCQDLMRRMKQIAHFNDHNRGIKSANFVVLKNFAMPAVLLEVGFITNTDDLKQLVNPRFQQATALAVYNGIADYFERVDNTFKAQRFVIGGKP